MGFAGWRLQAIETLNAGSHVVETARGPVEFAESGRIDGPVVLVLHGTPGGYDQGVLIGRSIVPERARRIAVSRPGYLRTPLPTGRTPAEQADAYAALLDELGTGAAVVLGVSGGGPSAFQFALRHPARCRGLVLVSAVVRRRALSERHPVQKLHEDVLARSDRLSSLLFRALGKVVSESDRAMLATVLVLPDELRGAGRRNDREQCGQLPAGPSRGIRTPTLVLHGTADRVVGFDHAEAAAQAVPGARLVPIAGGGHDVFTRRAEEVGREVAAFIDALPPSV